MENLVSSPSHYVLNSVRLEPIELTGRMNSALGQALQYIIRRNSKFNALEDLQKAAYWLKWAAHNLIQPGVPDFEAIGDRYAFDYFKVVLRFFKNYHTDGLTRQILFDLFPEDSTSVSRDSLERAIQHVEETIKAQTRE